MVTPSLQPESSHESRCDHSDASSDLGVRSVRTGAEARPPVRPASVTAELWGASGITRGNVLLDMEAATVILSGWSAGAILGNVRGNSASSMFPTSVSL